MAFQFVHLEGFSRKGDDKGRSTSFVFSEARRDPAASVHVQNPSPPIIVFGSMIEEVEAMHDAAVESAVTAVKGGKPRKIRSDQKTLHTVIASHPYTMAEIFDDPNKRKEAEIWKNRTIGWLRSQYGDDLKSVVRHEDESHFHIHAYILPLDDPEIRALRHHPGVTAKRAIMSAGPAEGEDSKALSKRADAAYKAAMRQWQDSYHESVGMHCGLTRIGPQRRRLTREAWQAEKVQATALKITIDRAMEVKARGESYIKSTKEESATIKAEADRQIAAAKAMTAAALAAQDNAIREQKKAKSMMSHVKREAALVQAAATRLQRLPTLLRSFWDGFRKTQLLDQMRKSVESEIESIRREAANAFDRANAAEKARRDAEFKAKNLRENLIETGRELATAREELAILRPSEQVQGDRLHIQI